MEGGPARLLHLLREAITIAESVPAKAEVLSYLHHARNSLGDAETRPRLRIDVLSGTTLAAGGPLPLSPSETAVLVALGVHGGRLHRDLLAAELYGDGNPRNAMNALKVTVHRVRRRTGRSDVIRRDRGGYVLADWVAVELPGSGAATSSNLRSRADVLELERLRSRLRAGRPGFMLAWTWFDDTEQRLRDLEHDITLVLAREAMRSGRYSGAADLADELLREDPLDEEAVELMLRACIDHGNGDLAGVHYRRYASRIKRETGLGPSEALRRLMLPGDGAPIAVR